MHMMRVTRGSIGLARSFATKPPTDAKRAGGIILFGGLVVGTAYLGAWQIHRYNWKVDKIAVRRAELALPPVPLAQVLSATSSEDKDSSSSASSIVKAAAAVRGQARDYQEAAEGACRAVVVGTWDHDASMLIGRRGAPDGLIGEKPQGMASSPSGYYLVTVLRLPNGQKLLVNRGWMPAAVAQAGAWDKPEGPVVVVGMVAEGEPQATFSPPNDPSSGTMLWLQLPVLAQALGVDDYPGLENGGPLLMEAVAVDPADSLTVAAVRDAAATAAATADGTPTSARGSTDEDSQGAATPSSAAAATGPLWFVPNAMAPWRSSFPAVTAGNASLATEAKKGTDASSSSSSRSNTQAAASATAAGEGEATWPMARGPKAFEAFPVMPETHAVYAATWLSLSAFGLAASTRLLRSPSAPPATKAAAAAVAVAAATATSSPSKTAAAPKLHQQRACLK